MACSTDGTAQRTPTLQQSPRIDSKCDVGLVGKLAGGECAAADYRNKEKGLVFSGCGYDLLGGRGGRAGSLFGRAWHEANRRMPETRQRQQQNGARLASRASTSIKVAYLVGLLRLLGGGGDAGADGPDGLVGDDDARLVLEGLEDGNNVHELVDALGEHGVDALLADRQGLANAEDAREALLKDVRELGRHQLVALLGGGQAELAAALRVANQAQLEAHVLHLVHRHLTGVGAAAPEVAVLRRDHDARSEVLVHHAHVQVRRAHIHVALVEQLGAWREVRNELRELRGLGRVALPVAANYRLAGHFSR
jgi:hypothetical protein